MKAMKQPKRFAHAKSPISAPKGTGKSSMQSKQGPMSLRLSEKPTKEDPKNRSSKKRG